MENARKTAVKLLCRLEQTQAYSNILLDEHFSRCQLDAQGKKFCAALFYGTLERRLTLDLIIKMYSSKPSDKLNPEVRNILRTALFQLLYMNGVPESAAVNEAVKLASKNRNPAVKSYVNGLLRAFLRAEKKLPEFKDHAEQLSFDYSCPTDLVTKWLGEYGENDTVSLLRSSLGRPPVTIKVNTCRISPEQLAKRLEDEGYGARVNKFFPDCLDLIGAAPEAALAYKDGLFHVQDISSRICCDALDAKPGMTVLDLCSAPGGKAFTVAELMENKGELYAFDLHENRVRLIRSGANRLGLDIIKASPNNAKQFNENLTKADRVLCDVPCSGLGVIRRKPEIKYRELSDFDDLPQVQYEILDVSSRYVKVGGILVYSTCTLSKAENEDNIKRFLAQHSEFSPAPLNIPFDKYKNDTQLSVLPHYFNSDGFFIAKLVRTR
ncbi:MAG: 16S rRNA (cytosine(967)-C(5))-methyltransferase RsmB [Oscillospiraceae bacterium]